MGKENEEKINGYENETVEEVSKVNDLSFFMPDKNKESAPQEFVLSKRFKDNDGRVIPFKMKAITVEELERIEKDCTDYKKVRGQGRVKELDQKRFYEKVALHSTVYPDFTDKKLLKAYEEHDAVNVAKAILNVPGEYTAWIDKALSVNELDEDYSEIEDEVKN